MKIIYYYCCQHSSSKKRSRKKKAQTGSGLANESNNEGSKDLTNSPLLPSQVPSTYANISIKDIQLAMDVLNVQQKPAKTQEEALQKPYQFWSTQPVPKMGMLVCL